MQEVLERRTDRSALLAAVTARADPLGTDPQPGRSPYYGTDLARRPGAARAVSGPRRYGRRFSIFATVDTDGTVTKRAGPGPRRRPPVQRPTLRVTTAGLFRRMACSARQLVASTDGSQRTRTRRRTRCRDGQRSPRRRRPSPVRQRSSSAAPPRAVDDGREIDPGARAEPAGRPVELSALLQRLADDAVQLTEPRLSDPAPRFRTARVG